MSTLLEEAEKLLARMTTVEKAQLLLAAARQVSNDFPGIERDPQICGGDPCIVRTRIPVWLVEQARRLGMDAPAVLRSYPALRPADVFNAWVYAETHPDEIDRQIRENEEA